MNRLIADAGIEANDARTQMVLYYAGFGILTKIDVSAIDPVALMQAVDNPEPHAEAGQAHDVLNKAVEDI